MRERIASCPTKFPRFINYRSHLNPLPQVHNLIQNKIRKMVKSEFSDSKSQEIDSSDDESENEAPRNEEKPSEYELQRLKRIEENKKRMEALGLHKIANSFMGTVQKSQKKKNDEKGKRKMVDEDEDEDYKPSEIKEEMSSSDEEAESDDEKFSWPQKGKAKKNSSTPKKRVPKSEILDDDEALMQAIALSLKDYAVDGVGNPKEQNLNIQEDIDKRKRKKMGKQFTSRVQMTLDEMVIHFFQFDEVGKGNITLGDIERVAMGHDFTWSEKEIADMIYCFDSDGDGKLNLDDFRKIVGRCNMIKD